MSEKQYLTVGPQGENGNRHSEIALYLQGQTGFYGGRSATIRPENQQTTLGCHTQLLCIPGVRHHSKILR